MAPSAAPFSLHPSGVDVTDFSSGRWLFMFAVVLLTGGCSGDAPSNPAGADTTYGAPVDATDAIPAPAIAAEPDPYVGHRITADGRILNVERTGCTLHVDTESETPFQIDAPRSEKSCTWQVPSTTKGFAIATGTLRRADDTLRMTAPGVRITPTHLDDDGT